MIDHMLVDLKKYYEGQAPNYIGRTIQRPKNDVALYDVLDSGMFISEAELLPGQTTRFTTDYKILGQVTVSNITYLALMIAYTEDTSTPHFRYARLNDILQNGGVSHSHLTHVHHALILVRKEISMALEKMKYQLKDWYEGQVPNYIGMTIKAPQQNLDSYIIETFPSDTETVKLDHNNASDGNTASPDVLDGQIVQGQIALDADDCWLMIFVPATTGIYAGGYLNRWIKYTDLVQNGGGVA